jgi:uncharacterized damage-inducible protein DinB
MLLLQQKIMKFHPLFFLFFTSILGAQDSSFLKEFQQKLDNAGAYTIEVAELMPTENYNYRPTEEQKSFQEQLLHMASNMNWLSSSYLGGKKVDADLREGIFTPSEAIAITKEVLQNAKEAVKNLQASQLEEKVEFFAGPMTKRQILVLMNDHYTHHRAQIIVYLRLNGIKPPRYRGW